MTVTSTAPDLADHVVLERRGGIVRLRMHTRGGPAVYSLGLHRAWGRAWREAGEDPGTEVVVFTGTGDRWIAGVDPGEELFAQPFHTWPAEAVEGLRRDRARMLENLVFGVDVPTIGVVNGPGWHTELGLFCDLTICTPDAVFFDGHFAGGEVPGDGMALALQALLGDKRAAFHLYTGQPITAAEALRLGLVNEVLPAGEAQDRAWELAELMARQSPTTRRMTHALVQRRLRRALLDDHDAVVAGGLLAAFVNRPRD